MTYKTKALASFFGLLAFCAVVIFATIVMQV